jgi:hypothetical protein
MVGLRPTTNATAEEAFNEVTIFVLMAVERTLDETVTARWNHRLDVVGGEMLKQHVGIVSFVSTE